MSAGDGADGDAPGGLLPFLLPGSDRHADAGRAVATAGERVPAGVGVRGHRAAGFGGTGLRLCVGARC